MTTSPVVTITEELVAELERFLGFGGKYLKVSSETLRALLAERAAMQSQIKAGIVTQDNLELYRKDAERYRHASKSASDGDVDICICRVDWRRDGSAKYDLLTGDSAHSAIDQAMQEQQP